MEKLFQTFYPIFPNFSKEIGKIGKFPKKNWRKVVISLKYHALTNHKYIEQRRHDEEFKAKQKEYYKEYYQKYKERPKYIYQNNYFNPPTKKDFIVRFSF